MFKYISKFNGSLVAHWHVCLNPFSRELEYPTRVSKIFAIAPPKIAWHARAVIGELFDSFVSSLFKFTPCQNDASRQKINGIDAAFIREPVIPGRMINSLTVDNAADNISELIV